MKCPNCGSQLKTGAKFCPSCGKAVAVTTPTSAPTSPVKPTPVSPVQPQQATTKPMGAMNMNAAKKSVAEKGLAGYWKYFVDAIKYPGKQSDSTQVYGLITAIILAIINTITIKLFVSGMGKALYSLSDGALKTESPSINLFLVFGLFIGIILVFSVIGFGLRYIFGDVKENFLVYTNDFMHYAVSSLILAIIGCVVMMSYSTSSIRIALLLFGLQLVILTISFVQSILQTNITYKFDKLYVVLLGLIISIFIVWVLTGFVIEKTFMGILSQYLKPSELTAIKIAFAGISQAFASSDGILEYLKDPKSLDSLFNSFGY
ncbi:DUF6574 domain-containing protein [Latilactobacillus sakei]|uniref:DUF6574 domain-containing protein n=1 Tax=Latilactobacillus sakei TaxID=1599 RepID=UPI0038871A0F